MVVLADVGVTPLEGSPGPEFAATELVLASEHRADEDLIVSATEPAALDVRDSAEAWVRVILCPDRPPVVVRAGAWRRIVAAAERPAARPGFLAPAGAEPFDKPILLNPLLCPAAPSARVHRTSSASGDIGGVESRFQADGTPASGEPGMTAAELETPYWRLLGAQHARALVTDICRVFYGLGWASGTGGSISIRHGSRVYMAPSGVQKERMLPQDIFALDKDCNALYSPKPRWPGSPFRLSECAPLFSLPYTMRGAGACLHSHAPAAVAVTLVHDTEFRVTHLEMIKGLSGHGFHDDLVIPIINNTARECMLVDSMREAMLRYPRAPAVLVRRHGVYIWGDTWERAKAQAECLHYLFELALKMRDAGVSHSDAPATAPDCNSAAAFKEAAAAAAAAAGAGTAPSATASAAAAAASAGGKRPRDGDDSGFAGAANSALAANSSASAAAAAGAAAAGAAPCVAEVDAVLLDIEGCTTPLSFVHETLFPFARAAMRSHLRETARTAETAADLRAIAELAASDAAAAGSPPPFTVPDDMAAATDAEVEACVAAAAAVAEGWAARDRKAGPLKALQGHIWRAGYASGALQGQVFAEVPSFMESVAAAGKRLCIYSSGSREAQALLFGSAVALPEGWAPPTGEASAKRSRTADEAGSAAVSRDLRPRIAAYFDTTCGAKTEAASYASVALSLGVAPGRVLFATDSLLEAAAAAEAGMRVAVTDRPGNKPLTGGCGFPVVSSLSQLLKA